MTIRLRPFPRRSITSLTNASVFGILAFLSMPSSSAALSCDPTCPLQVCDDFEGSAPLLMRGWIPQSFGDSFELVDDSLGLGSQVMRLEAATEWATSLHSNPSGLKDLDLQVRARTEDTAVLYARTSGGFDVSGRPAQAYGLEVQPGSAEARLVMLANGNYAVLGRATVDWIGRDGFEIRLFASGSRLRGWVDGEQLFDVQDYRYATGNYAVGAMHVAYFDDFKQAYDPDCALAATATQTHAPTDTPTPLPTKTPTYTGTPTETPTHTDTATATETPTHTYSDTPTETPTHTFTHTASSTPTATETPTATATFTAVATATPISVCPRSVHNWISDWRHWPVNHLQLGKRHLDRRDLLKALRYSRNDSKSALLREWIAVKLNLAAGAAPGAIEEDLEEAEDLLSGENQGGRHEAQHNRHRNHERNHGRHRYGHHRDQMRDLAEVLRDFNHNSDSCLKPTATVTSVQVSRRHGKGRHAALDGEFQPEQRILPDGKHLAVAPNPVQKLAYIVVALPQAGQTRILLYDLSGYPLETLDLGSLPAGESTHSRDFGHLAGGVYLALLQSKQNTGWVNMDLFKMAVQHR